VQRLSDAIGLTGTPAQRMRAKLVGMAIGAILLMLIVMWARHCLR
jgi:hypothetical protein